MSWEVPFTRNDFIGSPPAVVDDSIFFATDTFPAYSFTDAYSSLHALDRSSGDEVWTYPAVGLSVSTVAAGGGAVFLATTESVGVGDNKRALNGRLYAVELDSGELRWQLHEEDIGVWTSPAVTEDLVIIGLSDGRVEALDIQTGEVEWVFEIGVPIDSRFPGGRLTGPSAPSVADGLVYFGDSDGKVRALDLTTGELRWEFQTNTESGICKEGCGWISTSPVISDGVLYIGNEAGYFYALEAPSR